jgi:hypothetical protein
MAARLVQISRHVKAILRCHLGWSVLLSVKKSHYRIRNSPKSNKMNSRKDIFTAFQEGSRRLAVQPSTKAWQHLEHRLDGQKRQPGRVVLMRWVTAVAALFILVAGVFFVSDMSSKPGVAFGNEPRPTLLEELSNDGSCNPFCLVLKERKALPDYYANPVRN